MEPFYVAYEKELGNTIFGDHETTFGAWDFGVALSTEKTPLVDFKFSTPELARHDPFDPVPQDSIAVDLGDGVLVLPPTICEAGTTNKIYRAFDRILLAYGHDPQAIIDRAAKGIDTLKPSPTLNSVQKELIAAAVRDYATRNPDPRKLLNSLTKNLPTSVTSAVKQIARRQLHGLTLEAALAETLAIPAASLKNAEPTQDNNKGHTMQTLSETFERELAFAVLSDDEIRLRVTNLKPRAVSDTEGFEHPGVSMCLEIIKDGVAKHYDNVAVALSTDAYGDQVVSADDNRLELPENVQQRLAENVDAVFDAYGYSREKVFEALEKGVFAPSKTTNYFQEDVLNAFLDQPGEVMALAKAATPEMKYLPAPLVSEAKSRLQVRLHKENSTTVKVMRILETALAKRIHDPRVLQATLREVQDRLQTMEENRQSPLINVLDPKAASRAPRTIETSTHEQERTR